MYKFDPINIDLIFVDEIVELQNDGELLFSEGDITIDVGDREDDAATIDQGFR